MAAFQIGQRVQLISGGPPMTVESLPGGKADHRQKANEYWCTWFKGATRDSDGFIEAILQLYVPPAK